MCIPVNSTLLSKTYKYADMCEGLHGGAGGTTECSGFKECPKAFSKDERTPEVEVCSVVFNSNHHIEKWCLSADSAYLAEHRIVEGAPQKAGASHVRSMTGLMNLLKWPTVRQARLDFILLLSG